MIFLQFSQIFAHFQHKLSFFRSPQTMGVIGALSEATSASEDALRLLLSVLAGTQLENGGFLVKNAENRLKNHWN